LCSRFNLLTFVSAAIAALVIEQAQENQNEKQNFTIVPTAENAVCHIFPSFAVSFYLSGSVIASPYTFKTIRRDVLKPLPPDKGL